MSVFRRNLVIYLAICGVHLLSLSPSSVRASIDITEWALVNGVQDFSMQDIVQDASAFTVVENPFIASHSAAVGPSTVETSYDFSWSNDFGSFDIQMSQFIPNPFVRVVSSGDILVTPTTDLSVSFDSSLTYTSSPGDEAAIRLRTIVIEENTNVVFFHAMVEGGGFFFEPPSGTLAFSGDVILPAGSTYHIDYLVEIHSLTVPNPQAPITADGFVHFDLQAVPEPSTLSLLAIGLLLTRRPRG